MEVNEGKELPLRSVGEEELGILRYNMAPIRFRHKPLIYYGGVRTMRQVFRNKLESEMGFVYVPPGDSKKELGYWYRRRGEEDSRVRSTPLVFAHGVGGLPFYYVFVKKLIRKIEQGSNETIILIDLPFVSLR